MPFPTTGVLTGFVTPPDEHPVSEGGNWFQVAGGATLQDLAKNSGSLQNPSVTPAGAMYWTPLSLTDTEVFASLVGTPTDSMAVLLRLKDVGSGSTWDGYGVYYFPGTPGQLQFHRITNNGHVTFATVTGITLVGGDGLGASMSGSTIRAFTRSGASGPWTQAGADQTDGTYPGPGFIGLWIRGTGRWDNFGGGAPVAVVTASFDFVSVPARVT